MRLIGETVVSKTIGSKAVSSKVDGSKYGTRFEMRHVNDLLVTVAHLRIGAWLHCRRSNKQDGCFAILFGGPSFGVRSSQR